MVLEVSLGVNDMETAKRAPLYVVYQERTI